MLWLFVIFERFKMQYFKTIFLNEAKVFLASQTPKTVQKIFYNIRLSEQTLDPKLFKKLSDDIWEFRTIYAGSQIRLLAFWDKRDGVSTLVVATHGFIKKSSKVPKKELERANYLKDQYFNINTPNE